MRRGQLNPIAPCRVLGACGWLTALLAACSSAPASDSRLDQALADGARADRAPPGRSDLGADRGKGDLLHPDAGRLDRALLGDVGPDGPAGEITVAPTFDLPSGTLAYRTAIPLSHPDPAAVIYLTMDGSTPSPASLRYSAPLRLSSRLDGVQLKAIAMVPGKERSPVATASYALNKGMIVHFRKPPGWSEPYLYYWSTTPDQRQASWPGVAMQPEEGGWYYLVLEGQSASKLIFSDKGANQSADLDLMRAEAWWLTDEWWDVDPEHFKRFAWPGGRFKAFALSEDDGNVQDKRLIGLLNQAGVKGTFHINSGRLGTPTYVTEDELKTVYLGHEISSHSVNHPCLSNNTRPEIESELGDDKIALSRIAGYEVRGHAFAFGCYNDDVLAVLHQKGFLYARGGVQTFDFRLPAELLPWRPCCHHSVWDKAQAFAAYQGEEMALLFMWGHAWELDGGEPLNNWDYMENQLLRLLGKRSDTWYAGLMEIADYLQALRAVELSLDGLQLENRSDQSVWVKTAAGIRELQSGAQLRLP